MARCPPGTIDPVRRDRVRELFASETIFTGPGGCGAVQTGCLRFSYVRLPDDPRKTPNTPRRYRCQPCLEIAMQQEKLEREGKPRIRSSAPGDRRWLAPGFVSGSTAIRRTAVEPRLSVQIRTGAEDGPKWRLLSSEAAPTGGQSPLCPGRVSAVRLGGRDRVCAEYIDDERFTMKGDFSRLDL